MTGATRTKRITSTKCGNCGESTTSEKLPRCLCEPSNDPTPASFDFDASDVIVVVTPTVCVFEPQNAAARAWLSDNVQDDATWAMGGVAVEPRFTDDLIEAVRDSGFQIHGEHGS